MALNGKLPEILITTVGILNKSENFLKNFIFIFIQISGLLLLQNPVFAHQPFGIADKNQDSYIEVSDAKISHAFYGIFDKNITQSRFVYFFFYKRTK